MFIYLKQHGTSEMSAWYLSSSGWYFIRKMESPGTGQLSINGKINRFLCSLYAEAITFSLAIIHTQYGHIFLCMFINQIQYLQSTYDFTEDWLIARSIWLRIGSTTSKHATTLVPQSTTDLFSSYMLDSDSLECLRHKWNYFMLHR